MTDLRDGRVEASLVTTRRRTLAIATATGAGAVGMGLLFRFYYHVSPMLPRPVLGGGAIVLLLAAAVVQYLRHRLAVRGVATTATSTERLMYVLYGIGTMWATLAIF